MDEIKEQRARQAASALGNPALREAFEDLDAELVEAWREAETFRDREGIHARVRGLREARDELFRRLEEAAREEAKARIPEEGRFFAPLWRKLQRAWSK